MVRDARVRRNDIPPLPSPQQETEYDTTPNTNESAKVPDRVYRRRVQLRGYIMARIPSCSVMEGGKWVGAYDRCHGEH